MFSCVALTTTAVQESFDPNYRVVPWLIDERLQQQLQEEEIPNWFYNFFIDYVVHDFRDYPSQLRKSFIDFKNSAFAAKTKLYGDFYKLLNYAWNADKNIVRIFQYIKSIPEHTKLNISSRWGLFSIALIGFLVSTCAEIYYVLDVKAHFNKRRQMVEEIIEYLSYFDIDANFDSKLASEYLEANQNDKIKKLNLEIEKIKLLDSMAKEKGKSKDKIAALEEEIVKENKRRLAKFQETSFLLKWLTRNDKNLCPSEKVKTKLNKIQAAADTNQYELLVNLLNDEILTNATDVHRDLLSDGSKENIVIWNFVNDWELWSQEWWKFKFVKFCGQNGYWSAYAIKLASVIISLALSATTVAATLSILSIICVIVGVALNVGLIAYTFRSLCLGIGSKGKTLRNDALAELYIELWNGPLGVGLSYEDKEKILEGKGEYKWEELTPQERKYICDTRLFDILKSRDESRIHKAYLKAFFTQSFGADAIALISTTVSGIIWAGICVGVTLGLITLGAGAFFAAPGCVFLLSAAVVCTITSFVFMHISKQRAEKAKKIFETPAIKVDLKQKQLENVNSENKIADEEKIGQQRTFRDKKKTSGPGRFSLFKEKIITFIENSSENERYAMC